jgi:hypothetical protein
VDFAVKNTRYFTRRPFRCAPRSWGFDSPSTYYDLPMPIPNKNTNMTAIYPLALVALASASFLPLLPRASAKTPEQVFTEERGRIVSVDMLNARGDLVAQGSGVALGADQVITTCDVAIQGESARVRWSGRAFKATPAPPQKHLNLCRLYVADMHAPSLALGSAEKLRVGQPVNAIGLPHARLGGRLKGNSSEERRNGRERICPMCDESKAIGLQEEHRRDPILSEGAVAAMRPYAGSRYMRISAPLLPGFSGGGLFDEQGRLIGILSPQHVEGESLAFVLPSDWLGSPPEMEAPGLIGSMDPGHGLAWLNQTLALEKKADWRRLLKLSQQEARRDPSNAAAWFNVGLLPVISSNIPRQSMHTGKPSVTMPAMPMPGINSERPTRISKTTITQSRPTRMLCAWIPIMARPGTAWAILTITSKNMRTPFMPTGTPSGSIRKIPGPGTSWE